MTRRSILEYAEAVRDRYLRSKKAVKSGILDEFVLSTGLHRKAAVRLLNRVGKKGSRKKTGRPKVDSLEAISALRVAWKASDRLCSKRFQPFLPELVGILKREGELSLSEDTESQLSRMSASTIDRVLRRYRASPSAEGCGVKARTVLAVLPWKDDVQKRLPMPLSGLHSDNGSEFINQSLYDYCRRHHIEFTRSRSYKKNDSPDGIGEELAGSQTHHPSLEGPLQLTGGL